MHDERRPPSAQNPAPRTQYLAPIAWPIAIVLVVAGLTLVGLWLAGYPPGAVLSTGFAGACGSPAAIALSLREAGPLLWCGLAAALCLRTGVLNIGLEGQYLVGAVVAAGLTTAWAPLPAGPLAAGVALVGAAAAGAAWALAAGGLERWRGVPIVLSTLLLNIVAAQVVGMLVEGPLRDPTAASPQTATLADGMRLGAVWSSVHLGVVAAAIAAVVAWIVLRRTVWGYELDAVGVAPPAARLAGIPVERRRFEALGLGGALAGLAGGVQILAVTFFIGSVPTAYGYAGIMVALLGRLHPAGVAAAALLVAMLATGFRQLERRMDIPRDLGDAVQAVLVIGVLVAAALTVRRGRR
jgi:ABC-type uncharacterized transport system permease subunit